MASNENSCSGGYDYEFVPVLPEENICIICRLALRNPRQIEECGHRFCESCLNELRIHNNWRADLRCPIDNQSFTENMVFKDRGTERTILNWKVKCAHQDKGCEWIGELNTVNVHLGKCNIALKEKTSNEALYKQLMKLNSEFSSFKSEKNKEISCLKEEMQNLKIVHEQNKFEPTELRNQRLAYASKILKLSTDIDENKNENIKLSETVINR